MDLNLRDERVKVIAEGNESKDGQIVIDKMHGKRVRILESVDSKGCYESFASKINEKIQSAVIGSFEEQRKNWITPLSRTLSVENNNKNTLKTVKDI
ncbi:unnamed protein product [Thlaspi arvense]|uniref:Uncharacterized protein n=1 Tax=Thlaspi arvense TaxID=13288 RepID=A0AAU9SQH8_THLAR|nr:unnamed protein product [Thlaspi arvense]